MFFEGSLSLGFRVKEKNKKAEQEIAYSQRQPHPISMHTPYMQLPLRLPVGFVVRNLLTKLELQKHNGP